MAPPRVTKAFVTKLCDDFVKDVDRALVLHETIAQKGQMWSAKKNLHVPINNPACRDLTQFIFFEVAAKFEDLAKNMFEAEVRSVLKVRRDQAQYIMGDLDNGVDGKLGWGAPAKLKARATNLLGADSLFFANIDLILVNDYQNLIAAHTVRNRMAHSGGSAQKKFVALIDGYGIPKGERQGLGVGRFLSDYPKKSTKNKKYLSVYLKAYEKFAMEAKAHLP